MPKELSVKTSVNRQSLKTFLAVAICAVSAGCVIVATGKYPKPSGAGVEVLDDSKAKVNLAAYSVVVVVEGYTTDAMLIGPVVPVIPLGQWKWLTGIGKDDLRVSIELQFSPKTTDGTFAPGSVRILAGDRQYAPTEIKSGRNCRVEPATLVDPTARLIVVDQICVWFLFSDLRPPDGPFSVMADGLPSIQYTLERGVAGGMLH